MKKTFLLALSVSAIAGSFAFANKEVGNGGDGIIIANKVYLFDLYETNNHLNPHFSSEAPTPIDVEEMNSRFQDVKKQVEENFKQGVTDYSYNDFVLEIARKVTELKKTDLLFGYSVSQAILAHRWSFVPYTLSPVDDDDGTDIEYAGDLVQIAVRSLRTIKLDNGLVQRMDLSNLVATVFHEAIYSLLRPELVVKTENGKEVQYHKQFSRRAREILSYLFSGPLTQRTLKRIAANSIPVAPVVNVLLPGLQANVLAYDFNTSQAYFDPTDEKSVKAVFTRECEDVNPRSLNHIVILRSTILSFNFGSYSGEMNSEKFYFGLLYPDKNTVLNVLFRSPATPNECVTKLMKAFEKATQSISKEAIAQ
jgi:hypothetical protein